ncbi:PaaI family thioesterase [Hydrogenophaga sp.]|uniref:PaaI family thioesterase n=1 Tax=Hydrogenophaga sp. TaxID=1904254 RepID=UPI00260E1921|nr:PaaI family thioesterase [Hydrogenophaga sp.]MDM7951052.1 PaaI family thioesterase [Hydrogenophaga sp.]
MRTPEEFNRLGQQHLPAHLGIVITRSDPDLLQAELQVRAELMAPNGFLHAGSVVTLADTLAGYGCVRNLPDGASGFTTVELKSNHLGTVREGTVVCEARPAHLGRTTQVWDATVSSRETGRTLALFRCTQLLLYPK